MACETCGAPNADFFTTRGQAVCRICFYRDQTALQDARAEASLAEEMPEGLSFAESFTHAVYAHHQPIALTSVAASTFC